MQALIDKLGMNLNYLIYAAITIVILLLAWIVLRMVFGKRVRTPAAGRARQPRLGVIDAYDLDRQRQLVLVRRDNVEHLIMIGGPNDVLLESTIVRSGVDVRQRPSPSVDEPGSIAPPPVPELPSAPAMGAAPRAPAAPIAPPSPPPLTPVTRAPVTPPPPPRVAPAPAPPPLAPIPLAPVTAAAAPPASPAPLVGRPVDEPPPKPKYEFPRLAPRPPEPRLEAAPPLVEAPRPVEPPKFVEAPRPVVAPPPMIAPRPIVAAPKPVIETLKPFEPISLEPVKPAAPAPAKPESAKAADPLEALEEEMAKLLGRPPGAGASKG